MTDIQNKRWQPIPGCKDIELFPFIRKPDIVSCNSYLLRTPAELVILDPGADGEQMSRIMDMAREEGRAGRTVTFYLTHCHVDHCYQLASAYRGEEKGPFELVAEQAGTDALRNRDDELTLAKVFGWVFPPSSLEIHYTPLGNQAPRGEVSMGTSLEMLTTGEGLPLSRHTVPLHGAVMEVFHTPGHSPDSACYLLGKLLFTGDLLFAADPGIAGQAGWDRDDLIRSVKNVLWLLRSRDIEWCCPGHGRVLTKERAMVVLESMLQRAGALPAGRTYDLERVRFTSDYALDILTEANEAFSVLAGRLYYLSYYLEELEESEESRRCMESIQADKIDDMLTGFHRFVEEFKEGRKIQLQVVLKAIQTIQSIERLFLGTDLERLMDVTMLRRTGRLLHDFTNAIQGVEFHIELAPHRLDELVERTVGVLLSPPPSEDELFDALGDDQAYLCALARRIAHIPVYDQTTFIVAREDGSDTLVMVDGPRFVDALCGLLEEYVGVEASDITLTVGAKERPLLTITDGRSDRLLGPERLRSHRRRFELAGAELDESDRPVAFMIWPDQARPGSGRSERL